jgi:nucleotide-binding universal stress UspA family protein
MKMVKISRILVPVDFSERCLGMTHYARALAEKYDAEIVLLHVINPVFITPEIGMAPPAAVAVPSWLISEKNKLLEEFAKPELAGVQVRRLVYEGIPEMQIVEIAKSEDVQLVVMPTHGYGVFRRFLIGSVTAKVLDDLPAAVLTGIHMEKHAHDGKEEFPTIACAVDMKAGSSQTLLSAARLATDFGAKLGVIHVRPGQGQGSASNADLQPQLEELVTSELAKNNFSFASGRLVSSVQGGEIAQTICGFAERIGAKLLVIGRDHGEESGGKPTGRLRTQTYSIIRQASCPVLSL